MNMAGDHIRVNCVAPGSIEFPGGVWDQGETAYACHMTAR